MTDILHDPYDPATDLTIGSAKGETALVWYVDYTCPSTRTVADLLRQAATSFGEDALVLAVRQAPSPKRLPGSDLASRAAVAAAQQGKFAQMSDALFRTTLPIGQSSVDTIASDLELDMARFAGDLSSTETTDKVASDRASAEASDIFSTPSLFIENRRYLGAWDRESLIEGLERGTGLRLKITSLDFFAWAASAGLVLILATLAALLVANIGFHDAYERLRETELGLSFGPGGFSLPLEVWINDGLMAVFFLLVGIEIKRELAVGELSDLRSAALPISAALGGMLVPAAIYAAINIGTPTAAGWGIPMATDIAFTLGLMALLGDRVSTSLKIFVSALAIADDLGAIVVIALFYGHGFDAGAFAGAAAAFAAMIALNRMTIYSHLPYLLLGLVLWTMLYLSGVHATLAGVLTAAAVPTRAHADPRNIGKQMRAVVESELSRPGEASGLSDSAYATLQNAIGRLRDPGFHLEKKLERWSSYLILPLVRILQYRSVD